MIFRLYYHRHAIISIFAFTLLILPIPPSLGDSLDRVFIAANADASKGKRIFKKCKACHLTKKNAKNKIGPNLYGVVGKEVASVKNFKYSKALIDYGGTWTPSRLLEFLKSPKKIVKGTKMVFVGLKKEQDRIDIIAYLNQNSDKPLSLAETTPEQKKISTKDSSENEFGTFIIAKGVETTFYACSACHSERIITQQGLSRSGWEELIEWMIEEQGMSELEENDRQEILDYLSTNYNVERSNWPQYKSTSPPLAK